MFSRFASFITSPLGRFLRGLVSLLLLGWLIQLVDWRMFQHLKLASISWAQLLAGVVCALLAFPLCALRWQHLLNAQGVRLPFPAAHAIIWIGQFYNGFLPGGIGGDAARLTEAFVLAPDQKRAITAATAFDRVIGFLVLLGLALPAIAFFKAPAETPHITLHASFWAAGIGGCAGLLGLRFLPQLVRRFTTAQTWTAKNPYLPRTRTSFFFAVICSVGVWILDFVSGWFLAHSLGLPLDLPIIALALIAAYLSTLLPISLGGHGLREGSLLFALAALTFRPVDDPRLVSFSLLFLGVNLLSSFIGGAVVLATTLMRKRCANSAGPHSF
jgi:glycosyltransferase 2 family protein